MIEPSVARSLPAAEQAESNYQANLRALSIAQSSVANSIGTETPVVSEWLYGRDESLTALLDGSTWWSGCSLPNRAARQMLKDFSLDGVVGCFLDPPHAASIRVALDKLRANQAIIVIQPEVGSLSLGLRCENFLNDISAGRLWFVCGEQWAESLAHLFQFQPGLPTPGHFIRLPVSDAESIERLVAEAQKVFAAENTRRAARVRSIREGWDASTRTGGRPSLLVLEPSQFSLWNDAGQTLAETLKGSPDASCKVIRLDIDDPRCASPLILAEHAASASAVVAADIARADAPGVIADSMPWITWITKGIIPPTVTAGPNDRLLLADPSWHKISTEAHWPADRIAIARWPRWNQSGSLVGSNDSAIVVIEETAEIVAPEGLEDYSSHRLLWDSIAHELKADPLAAGGNPAAYLASKMRYAGIDVRGFDHALFLDRLIHTAIRQGVVRAILEAGLTVRLYGGGWAEMKEFEPFAAGPVTSREQVREIVQTANVILNVSPTSDAHPLDAVETPVVRLSGKTLPSLIRELRGWLSPDGRANTPKPLSTEDLSLPLVLNAVKRS